MPKKAAQHLDDEATLQMIYEGTKGAYIVFRSEGEVEAETSIEDHEITINFNVTEEKNNEEKAHIYYLKEDLTYDTIRVFVNEDEIPFSKVTHM